MNREVAIEYFLQAYERIRSYMGEGYQWDEHDLNSTDGDTNEPLLSLKLHRRENK